MKCCGANCVQIATGEVTVFRCMSCYDTKTCCVKCHATVGGTRESEWLELRCRKCGHTTNLRQLMAPNQTRLFQTLTLKGGTHGT